MGITKMEAARRQIETAVRVLLRGEDPIAVHTLAAAAFRILRDLAEQKGSHINEVMKLNIASGKDREFWNAFSKVANFLKHADKDAEAELEVFQDDWNDGLLFLGALYYQSLGGTMTSEMTVIGTFFAANHPEFARETGHPQFQELIKGQDWFRKASRSEQLEFALGILTRSKAAPGIT